MTLTSSVLYCGTRTFLYQGRFISRSLSTTGRLLYISTSTLLLTLGTRPPVCNNRVGVLLFTPYFITRVDRTSHIYQKQQLQWSCCTNNKRNNDDNDNIKRRRRLNFITIHVATITIIIVIEILLCQLGGELLQ